MMSTGLTLQNNDKVGLILKKKLEIKGAYIIKRDKVNAAYITKTW